MKNKQMILMVVAVGCGLVAAVMTASLNGGSRGPETVDVLVAAKDLPLGYYFGEQDVITCIGWIAMDKNSIPEGAIKKTDGDPKPLMVKKKLNRTKTKGDMLHRQDFSDNLGLTMLPGQVATSVRVNAEMMGGGFVLPGSQVDVMLTERINGKPRVARVLKSVTVAAVDVKPKRDEGVEAIQTPQTVTLALSPSEAAQVILAKARGELHLTLRNPNAKARSEKSDETDSDGDPVTDRLNFDKKEEAAPVVSSGVKTVKVLFVKVDAPAGTPIDDVNALFEEKDYPGESVPENMFAAADGEQLKGKKLTKPVYAGMPLIKAVTEGEVVVADTGKKDVPAPVVVPEQKTFLVILQGQQRAKTFVYDSKGVGMEVDAPAPTATPEKKPDNSGR